MKAIILTGAPNAVYTTTRPPPQLRPDYILIDVHAVALNPTDWKHAGAPSLNIPDLNHNLLSGCDYAGVVAADSGPDCLKAWKRGDRVCGFAHGANMLQPEDGAFAEQIVAKSGVQMRIPERMSFEDAAGLGVAVVTVGQGLFQRMGMRWPGVNDGRNEKESEGEWMLIYGGSSGMGTVGIQFAKLSGYRVVTTCSPRNFEMVKSFGADEVFDYRDPEAVEGVKRLTGGKLKMVWDTIGVAASSKFCGQVIAEGGHIGLIGMTAPEREDITKTFTLGYTAVGERVEKPFAKISAEEAVKDYEWMRRWVDMVDGLLAEGKVRPHPPKVRKGLENVIEGMQEMKEDKVSGQKLVYTL